MAKLTALLGLVYLLICSTGCVSVKDITFRPSDRGILNDETIKALKFEELELLTDDQETIYALHLEKPEAKILTIYLHGNAGNLHQRLGVLAKIGSLGTSVLAISYRGYPLSTGEPSEQGLIDDAESAVRYAQDILGYSNNEIVIFGRSLGSSVATALASGNSYYGLILVTPFTNAKELYEAQPMIRKLLIVDEDDFINTAFRNNESIPSINTPTLVVHGTDDSLIPYKLGEAVYTALASKKRLLRLNGADHNNFGFAAQSDNDLLYWQAVQDVLRSKW